MSHANDTWPRRVGVVGGARAIGLVAGLVAIACALTLLANAIGGVSVRLFGTDRIDRSAPVVLRELRDVATYTAATGEFQAMIDIERDVRFVPSFLAGERTIFVGIGTVDATVDFSGLGGDAVVVGPDGRVSVTLPVPVLGTPVIDPARSRVANRDRGIVNRVHGVFTDSPTSERDLYLQAQRRLLAAARRSDLRARAEANTREMLRALLRRLGYSQVEVVFTTTSPERATVGV